MRLFALAAHPGDCHADTATALWVRPELVAEVKFLTWTEDNLLRQVVYERLGEDKPAAEVRRATRGAAEGWLSPSAREKTHYTPALTSAVPKTKTPPPRGGGVASTVLGR
jgi:ATP dependent DNA ligase C terminal region